MTTIFVTGGSGFVGQALLRALCARGDTVRALARSEEAAVKVAQVGATPVAGDLSDNAALRRGMEGCELVFHVAAAVGYWGDPDHFYEVNVRGTERMLAAALASGVSRFLHVSTESVLLGPGRPPVVDADESYPRADPPFPLYAATKAQAEDLVLAANRTALVTMIARPRLIWGPGDTSLLGRMRLAISEGRFLWINNGEHLTSSVHIDNLIPGLLQMATRGRPGAIYYMTDGPALPLRTFYEEQLLALGVTPPPRSLPYRAAYAVGWLGEQVWRRLPLGGQPPLTRYVVSLLGKRITLDDSKARRELGYVPRVTFAEGIKALQAAAG